jgi:diguanylate cyclase (GGDEF)-like protein
MQRYRPWFISLWGVCLGGGLMLSMGEIQAQLQDPRALPSSMSGSASQSAGSQSGSHPDRWLLALGLVGLGLGGSGLLWRRMLAKPASGAATATTPALAGLLRATLNFTTDALLVVDGQGRVLTLNTRLVEWFKLPIGIADRADLHDQLQVEAQSNRDLRALLSRVQVQIRRGGGATHRELIHLIGGRIIEEYCQVQTADRQFMGWIWNFRDVTEQHHAEEVLRYSILHDALTGLPNRSLFTEELTSRLGKPFEEREELFALVLLDIDRFKAINEGMGHSAGDRLLIEVAQRLRDSLRRTDFVARLGSDEFALLLPGLSQIEQVLEVVERIQADLVAPIVIEDQDIYVNLRAGIVLSRPEGQRSEDWLKAANLAMTQAKQDPQQRYVLFEDALQSQFISRWQLERDLHQAIERQELRVYYQPIIHLPDQTIAGFEALVRWHHQDRGFISPGEFIPVAEETGMIVPIGLWVLREACVQMQLWQSLDSSLPLQMAVNLSVHQLRLPDLYQRVLAVLQETGLPPICLKLEVTESVLVDDADLVIRSLSKLRKLGVKIALDDFGTGYSSLSYLNHLPIDILKIDRSFIENMTSNTDQGELVRGIVSIAKRLGLEIVSEGIETQAQYEALLELQCDYGQGFLFSKAIPAEDILAMFSAELRGSLHQDHRKNGISVTSPPSEGLARLLAAEQLVTAGQLVAAGPVGQANGYDVLTAKVRDQVLDQVLEKDMEHHKGDLAPELGDRQDAIERDEVISGTGA